MNVDVSHFKLFVVATLWTWTSGATRLELYNDKKQVHRPDGPADKTSPVAINCGIRVRNVSVQIRPPS